MKNLLDANLGRYDKKEQEVDKILIVDDEPEICLLLSAFLKSKGYTTIYAHTLNDGLSVFKKESPDLVILDVNLPDGEGFDIVPDLKKEDAKVIMITARDGEREVKIAEELEVNDFIRKPFSLKRVVESLERIAQS